MFIISTLFIILTLVIFFVLKVFGQVATPLQRSKETNTAEHQDPNRKKKMLLEESTEQTSIALIEDSHNDDLDQSKTAEHDISEGCNHSFFSFLLIELVFDRRRSHIHFLFVFLIVADRLDRDHELNLKMELEVLRYYITLTLLELLFVVLLTRNDSKEELNERTQDTIDDDDWTTVKDDSFEQFDLQKEIIASHWPSPATKSTLTTESRTFALLW